LLLGTPIKNDSRVTDRQAFSGTALLIAPIPMEDLKVSQGDYNENKRAE